MQKKIIALAVAGLVSGAAFAQTNVTLYGRLDVGYVYSKSDFSKFAGIENGKGIGGGSSRIGIRGEEALGNGLKAIFEAEWGTKTDEGGGIVDPRWSYVGLSGNFGRVIAGRLKTPTDLYAGSTSFNGINGLMPANEFRSKLGSLGNRSVASNKSDILNGSRWNNSISYISPNFSGAEFAAVYSFGEKVNTSKDDVLGYNAAVVLPPAPTVAVPNPPIPNPPNGVRYYEGAKTTDAGKLGIGAKYANGPLYLMAAYEQRSDNDGAKFYNVASKRGFGSKGWNIGGSYDFKVVKLYANYSHLKANHGGLKKTVGLTGSDKESLWSLGLDVPVSRIGTVSVEYAQYKDYLDNRIGSNLGGRTAGHKAKGYAIGYKHVLSKRTSAYAYVSRFDNDRGINMANDKTGQAGEDQTNFVAGIVHVF
jgi:predicted porin